MIASLRPHLPLSNAVLLAVMVLAAPAAAQCVEGCVAIHTFTGETAGDTFGWVSDDMGDLDGDGVHDIAITAPFFGGTNAGRVYVYSGATGDLLLPVMTGSDASQLGRDVDPAGDVDHDGVIDIIAGAPIAGAGQAFVFSGKDGSVLRTFTGDSGGDQFGTSVIGLGDINGDDHSDVAISAPNDDTAGTNAGRVYVYSGLDSALLCTVDGETSFDNFGNGLAFVGDVTGDGVNDFAVGAGNAGPSANGLVYVYSGAECAAGGSPRPLILAPPAGQPATDFGLFFIDRGDINNDGVTDIYVSDFGVNRAHVYSGDSGAHLQTFSGTGGFGIGRFVGDVNGDCHDDLILASWIHPAGGTQAGRAEIFSGLDGSVLETFTHNVAFAQFGFDANGMGDVDGDGATDYLVTAANDSSGRGRVYLIAGGFVDPCLADIDCNGQVDFVDLLGVLAAWGESGVPQDLDGSGTVDFVDLLTVLSGWGPCV
ncbi:MAG: hypothetical protein HKO59_13275 [Phycisphaerales bacterium]|nr:FG-GAP repeat protein [Phycisphaerae bacterium]NNF42297.1 hypothetical protein [Phycisphaerales bacterium]NNM26933.1 hypothetical protein [Phycisphaerales bacterium]